MNDLQHIKEQIATAEDLLKDAKEWIEKNSKPEIVSGKWWVISSYGFVRTIYVTEDDKMVCGYGFDRSGGWFEDAAVSFISEIRVYRPAYIETEVIPLLEAEAKRRGLVPGAKVRCLNDNKIYTITSTKPKCQEAGGFCMRSLDYNIKIMQDGKWAEPEKDQWKAVPSMAYVKTTPEGVEIGGAELTFTGSPGMIEHRDRDAEIQRLQDENFNLRNELQRMIYHVECAESERDIARQKLAKELTR